MAIYSSLRLARKLTIPAFGMVIFFTYAYLLLHNASTRCGGVSQ